MNPERSEPTPQADKSEFETPFEVSVGDVLTVSRNLKDEQGARLIGPDGKPMTVLEDGWEVTNVRGINPTNGREGIELRNTANPDEFKYYSVTQLEGFQVKNEADILSRASSVASEMLGEVDQHSAEIAEEEPRITEDQAEEIGEAVMEAVDIDQPDESAEVAPTVETEEIDAEQVKNLRLKLSGAINHLETEGQAVSLGRRTIIENLRLGVDQLASSLNHYEDYPTDAMRTLLTRAVTGLYEVMGAAGRYSENTISDVVKYIEAAEAAIEESEGAQGVPTETLKVELGETSAIKADLVSAGEIVGGLRYGGLTQYADALEQIIKNSYSEPMNIDEVQNIVGTLQRIGADGGELDDAIRRAGTSLDRITESLRAARTRLPEQDV